MVHVVRSLSAEEGGRDHMIATFQNPEVWMQVKRMTPWHNAQWATYCQEADGKEQSTASQSLSINFASFPLLPFLHKEGG